MLERLGAEDKEVFQIYVDMQEELNRLTSVKNFIYGFKLSLLMTSETFIRMDDLYINGNNM